MKYASLKEDTLKLHLHEIHGVVKFRDKAERWFPGLHGGNEGRYGLIWVLSQGLVYRSLIPGVVVFGGSGTLLGQLEVLLSEGIRGTQLLFGFPFSDILSPSQYWPFSLYNSELNKPIFLIKLACLRYFVIVTKNELKQGVTVQSFSFTR